MANDRDEWKPERRPKSSGSLSKFLTRQDQDSTKEKTNLNKIRDEVIQKDPI